MLIEGIKMKKVILTYGTFDMFHIGHLKVLERLKELGDYLIVGVSTDSFNELKGKKTIIRYEDRFEIVKALRCVDMVIPEDEWEQKISDIKKFNVSVFGMGDDWTGDFDFLKEYCDVVYLQRTSGISSTQLKKTLKTLDREHIEEIKQSLDSISAVVDKFTQ